LASNRIKLQLRDERQEKSIILEEGTKEQRKKLGF
jgi:hypothetical protein